MSRLSSTKKKLDTRSLSLFSLEFPKFFLYYSIVMTFYVSTAFLFALMIDGYILPTFNNTQAQESNIILLASKVILQFILQGIMVIITIELLPYILPFLFKESIWSFSPSNPLIIALRNPMILSVLFFNLSSSLRGRLQILFQRCIIHIRESHESFT